MTKLGMWGLAGIALGCTLALPAQAQLADMSKAAIGGVGKLAGKISGKEVTPTTVAKGGKAVAEVSGTAPVPSATTDKSARVTFLDKQTNRRHTLVLVAGEPQVVGTLQVKLTKCLPDYSATLGQDVAWLDVTETAEGGGRSAPWFSGWMFNTYPEISTLDHPRYDMQLEGCGVKARQVVKASAAAPVIESAEPVVDTETPNDAPVGGDSSDPYFVPGVGKAPAETPAAPAETPAAPVVDAVPAAAQQEQVAPVEQPAAPVEAQPAGDQNDLHRMMDNGTY